MNWLFADIWHDYSRSAHSKAYVVRQKWQENCQTGKCDFPAQESICARHLRALRRQQRGMFNPQFWFRGSARTSAGVGDPGPKECEQMEPSVALEAELMGLGKGSELTIALAHESA